MHEYMQVICICVFHGLDSGSNNRNEFNYCAHGQINVVALIFLLTNLAKIFCSSKNRKAGIHERD